jgi:RimJ/RimL family protein N-acetyltransferase
MAGAGGALAGAASADATSWARLQRLVDSVARQQPRLAWAAGDRPDGTTVLVTDLASGWIPPGIDLPAAVTLLDPAFRYNELMALVGEVTLSASYQPGHYLPQDDDPPPTSTRARRTADIEEFGWELNRATHWRDGLPRIAHTLAMAAARQTGVADSEADELRQELIKAADKVLDTYADDVVNTEDVGNWQLLAAIDALVAGDKTVANYHLAWFLACTAVHQQ